MGHSRRRRVRGFTLLELMLVVTLIGILARLAIPNFKNFQCKAKQSEAKIGLKAIAQAELVYWGEWGAYVDLNTLKNTSLQTGIITGASFYGYTVTNTTSTFSVVAQDTVKR